LEADVRVAGRRYRLERSDFVPDRDFSLGTLELGPPTAFAALRAGKYGLARILPETTKSSDLTFLVDTSQSQPTPLKRVAEALVYVSKELAGKRNSPLVTVVAFDQDLQAIVVRAKPPLTSEQLAPLVARGRLGGTDLSYAAGGVLAQGLPHVQLVMLSDFENTLFPVEQGFDYSDLTRFDSLVADAAGEKALLAKYADPLGYQPPWPGVVARLDDEPARIVERLLQPTPLKTVVKVTGASWSVPGDDDYRFETAPPIGSALWAAAEYENQAPLQVRVNGKPKAPVVAVDDAALSRLLEQVIGQARMNNLLARYPHSDPAEAAQGLREIPQLAKAYGLISPLDSFVVESGGKVLAGRVIDASRTRLVTSMTTEGFGMPTPRANECPELVGLQERNVGEGCPPLYLSLSDLKQRIIADVTFAGNEPRAELSPHLDELVKLLTSLPALAKLSLRTASKAQAQGLARYLIGHGIAASRLEVGQLLPGDLPPRKPTPKCKTKGQQVLLEVRAMNLDYLNQRAVNKTSRSPTSADGSRLTKIEQLLRPSRTATRGTELEDARRLSERWVAEEPKSPLPYVALGLTLHSQRDKPGAARAYGSLFDLQAPGAGLRAAASIRLLLLAQTMQRQRHEAVDPSEQRWWELAMRALRQEWQDNKTGQDTKGGVEATRTYAYGRLQAGQVREAYGFMSEASHSDIVSRIELPVFAHLQMYAETRASRSFESSSGGRCWLPMQGGVLGAVLSWEDAGSEIEVNVRSTKKALDYDSVLTDRAAGATLKWLPLPEDDDAYPIRVSVRAERLGKNGYAFGVLRVLDYNGRGRASVEEKPFVLSLVGEEIPLYEPPILQRPQ
jgi:hypothetical protein